MRAASGLRPLHRTAGFVFALPPQPLQLSISQMGLRTVQRFVKNVCDFGFIFRKYGLFSEVGGRPQKQKDSGRYGIILIEQPSTK